MSKLPIVERLEALMAAATKGPYRAHDHNSMARVGEKPENWIGYAWVGRIKEDSGPDGSFDAGWLNLDRRKDGCKEYRERASADAHFVAEALNALPELLTTITELVSALEDLSNREQEYRRAHDLHGSGDTRTGRCWDLMRRAGDKARALLAGREQSQ